MKHEDICGHIATCVITSVSRQPHAQYHSGKSQFVSGTADVMTTKDDITAVIDLTENESN